MRRPRDDIAQIDTPNRPFQRNLQGAHRLERQSQVASKDICRSRRQQRYREGRIGNTGNNFMERSISTANCQEVGRIGKLFHRKDARVLRATGRKELIGPILIRPVLD